MEQAMSEPNFSEPSPSAQCKAGVRYGEPGWRRTRQCSRKAVRDGFCKQHHPDVGKARCAASVQESKRRAVARVYEFQVNEATAAVIAAARVQFETSFDVGLGPEGQLTYARACVALENTVAALARLEQEKPRG